MPVIDRKVDEAAEQLVERWRRESTADSPAGPLYAGGEYVETDIIYATIVGSGQCGTVCTGSRTRLCC